MPIERIMTNNNKSIIPDRPCPGLTTTALSIGNSQDRGGKCATGDIYTNKDNISNEFKKIKMASNITTVGTWNVRSLAKCGKLEELCRELENYKWDIIEVRWKGTGEEVSDNGHTFLYSGQNRLKRNGVGFLIRKEITDSILNFSYVSDRIISIRIEAKPKNVTIIQVYIPTSDYSDNEIEEFYEKIDESIKTTHKKDFIVVLGDWNAKAGEDAYPIWQNAIGRFGLGKTNSRGERLLEFAEKHKFVISNTLFNHKLSRKTTWHSPDGQTHNQIDYILTP